jgi:hypothetical protein
MEKPPEITQALQGDWLTGVGVAAPRTFTPDTNVPALFTNTIGRG